MERDRKVRDRKQDADRVVAARDALRDRVRDKARVAVKDAVWDKARARVAVKDAVRVVVAAIAKKQKVKKEEYHAGI